MRGEKGEIKKGVRWVVGRGVGVGRGRYRKGGWGVVRIGMKRQGGEVRI